MGVLSVYRMLHHTYLLLQKIQYFSKFFYLRYQHRLIRVGSHSGSGSFLPRIFVWVRVAALVFLFLLVVLIHNLLEKVEQAFNSHGSAVAEPTNVLQSKTDAQLAEYFVYVER